MQLSGVFPQPETSKGMLVHRSLLARNKDVFTQHDFDYMLLSKCSNTCQVFCKLSIGNHAGIELHTTGLE